MYLFILDACLLIFNQTEIVVSTYSAINTWSNPQTKSRKLLEQKATKYRHRLNTYIQILVCKKFAADFLCKLVKF